MNMLDISAANLNGVAITLSVLGTIATFVAHISCMLFCIELAASTHNISTLLVCETVKVAYHLWIFTEEFVLFKKSENCYERYAGQL